MKRLVHIALTLFLFTQLNHIQYVESKKLISSAIRANITEPLASSINRQSISLTNSDVKNSTRQSGKQSKSIHRLVGGHLHHAVYRKEENNFSAQPQNHLSKLYFRRKPWSSSTTELPATSTPSPTAHSTITVDSVSTVSRTLSTFAPPTKNTSIQQPSTTKETVFIVNAERYENPDYQANHISFDAKKDGFVESSAGEGKDDRKKDESKKTLSDQVAEGKYALIQNELFKTAPKRPGILSYASNPEIPSDTADNLGGLNQKEIWLAEDHLLVLKGGNLNSESNDEPWKPIDNYQAPLHQVKIPDNPVVPPPFRVQFEENGPIDFIGNNQLPPLINPFTNESLLLFPEGGFPKTETYSDDKTYLYARPGAYGDYKNATQAFIPHGDPNNNTFNNPFLNLGQLPFPPLFPPNIGFPPFPHLNGSLDNFNVTDLLDEDDPSFFYPPPYSFVYNGNYTSNVGPGPLVPGIILPPPPNFFGRLNEHKRKVTTPKPKTTEPTQKPLKSDHRVGHKTTTLSPLSDFVTSKFVKNSIRAQTLQHTQLKATAPILTPKPSTQLKPTVSEKDIVSFVAKEAITIKPKPKIKSRPVYYEYFDARINANVATTENPSPSVQTKQHENIRNQLSTTTKRPYNAYLPAKPAPNYNKQNAANIANQNSNPIPHPKPTTSSTVNIGDNQTQKSLSKQLPTKAYNSEIENIRHTIEFFKYQEKQKKQNDTVTVVRNPKTKAVYEYSFDASAEKTKNKLFHPSEFDSSPFIPMVKYSAPFNIENGFKAVSYTTVPTSSTDVTSPPPSAIQPYSNLQYLPIPKGSLQKKPSVQFIPFDSGVLKSIPLKHSEYSTGMPFTVTTQLPLLQSPWITVEKQVLNEVRPKEINVQIQTYSPTVYPPTTLQEIVSHGSSYINSNGKIPSYNGIYYPVQEPHVYQPQQNRTIMTAQQNAYLRQIETIRNQIRQSPNKHQLKVVDSPLHTYNNNNNNNNREKRPLSYPDSSFITSYQFDSQRFPQLSKILSPSYNLNRQHPQQQQRIPQTIPQGAYYPLNRDILVNYKYPLPAIDPNSEFLPPPHLLHPLLPAPPTPLDPLERYNRYSRFVRKQQPTVIQYKLPGDQNAGVFFYTPQDDKYNNKNNN